LSPVAFSNIVTFGRAEISGITELGSNSPSVDTFELSELLICILPSSKVVLASLKLY